ncbi:ABC transporter permease [Pseudomonas aeruginosa]|nr:ABC transporter permease [Pseudomonas aeruginosa]
MSLFSLFGALEIGLIFSLVALGVFISFRLLRFPDLTVDGSFPLGGAVCATLIALGWDPYSATLAATAAGALAGLATGLLNVKLKIMDLLASILMMIALYSINLRIMGKPNVPLIAEPTLFTLLQPEWLSDYVFRPLLLVFIVIAAKLLLDWFFTTQTMGIGTIVIGLAAVIVGESILPSRRLILATLAVILGAIVYRFFIALALNSDFIGLQAQDLNLVTAVLVTVALVIPMMKKRLLGKKGA